MPKIEFYPKKTKLLIVVKSIDGGTGTYVLQLLQMKRVDIVVCVLEKPSFRIINPKFNRFFRFLHEKNHYPEKYDLSFKLVYDFIKEIMWVNQEINHHHAQIILGVDIHANLIIQILKIFGFRTIKTILTTHIDIFKTLGEKSSKFISTIIRFLISFFYGKADVLITPSSELSKDMSNKFKISKKILSISYSIRPYQKRQSNYSAKLENTIISVGRLTEQKDFDNLINAFIKVNQTIPNSQLLIVGDGLKRDLLQQTTNKTKCADKVKFVGWKQNVIPYLNSADVFVLSSNREGFSWVLLEAMSVGLPVIATDVSYGPREILDYGKYGFLVPPNNTLIMSSQIIKLLKKPTLYQKMAHKAFKRSLISTGRLLWQMQRCYPKSILMHLESMVTITYWAGE